MKLHTKCLECYLAQKEVTQYIFTVSKRAKWSNVSVKSHFSVHEVNRIYLKVTDEKKDQSIFFIAVE